MFRNFMIDSCVEFSLIFGTSKEDCVIKAKEMFAFLLLINSSVTILFKLLVAKHISSHTTKCNQYFAFII